MSKPGSSLLPPNRSVVRDSDDELLKGSSCPVPANLKSQKSLMFTIMTGKKEKNMYRLHYFLFGKAYISYFMTFIPYLFVFWLFVFF